MADYYSAQLANVDAIPRVNLAANEQHGRVRVAYASFVVPAGNVATGKTIEMIRLPQGARLLLGRFQSTAMSSAGGDASVQIGDGSDADEYLGTTSVDAAAEGFFAATAALDGMSVVGADNKITLTTVTEAWVAAGVIEVWALYVLD